MVIKLTIANYNISKILVDLRSYINVMFYDYFLNLGLQKKDMPPAPFPIISFIGHTTYLKELSYY